ncbi:MAG: gfo/Idh/MocA family oxidoreductase, partial [Planctomycetaceae bacterium]|nr:gfo/Idh/MocA family oxidoreductase [Planctomycetaceae bacterium]
VEYAGPASQREDRLQQMRSLHYSDLSADRQVVAAVQAMEMILEEQAKGNPDCVVRYNGRNLSLLHPSAM